MFNLIFFTTNNTKLAHARYLAEDYGIRIEGFRQSTYHASYNEPRLPSRTNLLQLSYESALQQAKKAHIDTATRFFFLEDTSVILDALSTPQREVPGVDVKYWMTSQTFDSVNERLKSKYNNRKVTVRSDFVLHVPDFYRARWRLAKSPMVFTGFQSGQVVDKEYEITTNLVYPWLDNKSFNKWFVPENESVPISLLPISKANRYDFRRHAFVKMVQFLKERGLLTTTIKQMSLPLDVTPTLIVCGFTCAGKTTISQFLVKKYGYMHIEASDFMYLNYYLRHDVSSEIKIGDFAEKALREKPHIAAEKIAEYMDDNFIRPTIISGFRSRKEIDWLRNYFHDRKNVFVIFIKASESLRFNRHVARNRERKELSGEEFQNLDRQQVRMGLNEIAADPSVRVILNEKSFNQYYENFENSFMQRAVAGQTRDINLSGIEQFSGTLKLEDAILIALLSRWADSEARSYYTTTAIAKIINDIFPALEPRKHKDNVSRYFNQDFYPFYEIETNADENKRRYRLSNTGYGRAVQVYHTLIIGNEGSSESPAS